MENTHKCRACGRKFKPDFRNRERQSYCSRRNCQRQRRTLLQKKRRQAAVPQIAPSAHPKHARRTQEASVVSEAGIRAENPVIIGLISMFTGLTTLEDIERVYRQLWSRGLDILSADHSKALQNTAIIRLFENTEDQVAKKS